VKVTDRSPERFGARRGTRSAVRTLINHGRSTLANSRVIQRIRAPRLHPIDALVSRRDLVPADPLQELRHVVLATRVVFRVCVFADIANDQRIGADPYTVDVTVHDRVVPSVIVGIVDQRGPLLAAMAQALKSAAQLSNDPMCSRMWGRRYLGGSTFSAERFRK